jgi:hypothetical protein
MFTWGPPWHWRPKFSRCPTYYPGAWCLVWLWWSLWYVRRPVAPTLADAALYRALDSERDGRRYLYLPHDTDGHDLHVALACSCCGRTWTEAAPLPSKMPESGAH